MSRGFGGGSIGGGYSGGSSDRSCSDPRHYYRVDDDYQKPYRMPQGYGIVAGLVMFVVMMGVYGYSFISSGGGNDTYVRIPRSTIQRHALPAGMAVGQVGHSVQWQATQDQALLDSMNYFYDKTGIIPYVCYVRANRRASFGAERSKGELVGYPDERIIADMFTETSAEAYAQKLYDTLFDDEAHLLVLHVNDSSGYGSRRETQIWYYYGEEAAAVMDKQAGRIFMAYAERYDGNLSKTFISTADDIMGPPRGLPPWVKWLVLAVVGVLVLIAVIKAICKKIASRPRSVFVLPEQQVDETGRVKMFLPSYKKERQDHRNNLHIENISGNTYHDLWEEDWQNRD